MIDPLAALVIVAAGMAAGTVNTIVGSGSLITFPTLVLLGPPLVANLSNTVRAPRSDHHDRDDRRGPAAPDRATGQSPAFIATMRSYEASSRDLAMMPMRASARRVA